MDDRPRRTAFLDGALLSDITEAHRLVDPGRKRGSVVVRVAADDRRERSHPADRARHTTGHPGASRP